MPDAQKYIRGQIWWVDLPVGKTALEAGERPVVIISNNINTLTSEAVTGVSMSLAPKPDLPTHVQIRYDGNIGTILGETITGIDVRWIKDYYGTLAEETMKQVDLAVKIHLGFEPMPPKPDYTKPRNTWTPDRLKEFIDDYDNKEMSKADVLRKYHLKDMVEAAQLYYRGKKTMRFRAQDTDQKGDSDVTR